MTTELGIFICLIIIALSLLVLSVYLIIISVQIIKLTNIVNKMLKTIDNKVDMFCKTKTTFDKIFIPITSVFSVIWTLVRKKKY